MISDTLWASDGMKGSIQRCSGIFQATTVEGLGK